MKRLMVVILVSVLLLGAGTLSFAAGQTEGKAGGKALSLEVWFPEYEGGIVEKEVLPQFLVDHPNLTVNLTKVPWANLSEKLSTAVAGGVTPDLAILASDTTAVAINLKVLQPVDEFMKKDGISKDDFYPGSFNSYLTYNGVAYAIPAWMELPCIYWRTDLFKKAGFDAPPKTWDETIEYAKKMTAGKRNDGTYDQYTMNLPYKGDFLYAYFYDWLFQGGGSIVSDDGKHVTINSKASVDAITFYRDLSKKYDVALPPELCSDYGGEEFMNGKVALVIQGGWFKGAIRDKMGPDFEKSWDIAVPLAGKQLSFEGDPGAVIGMLSNKNRDNAWVFIKEFIKSTRFYEKASVVPASNALLNSQWFKADPKNKVFLDLQLLIKSGKAKPWAEPASPKLNEIHEAISKMVQQIVFNNSNPQKSADECAQSISKTLGIPTL
jgi:ABC-type glycerol-3-phosphate transport system substrate-binding protein